jgi:hypothetical protein
VHFAAKDGDIYTFNIMSDIVREAGLFDHMTSLTTTKVKTEQNEHIKIHNQIIYIYMYMCVCLINRHV